MKIGIFFVLWLATSSLMGQEKRAEQARGETTVSGHVFCADTNTPARMANVLLERVQMIDSLTSGAEKQLPSRGSADQTLLDGSFSIPHVAPGTYYVIASKTGYVSPVASMYVRDRPALPANAGEAKIAPKAAPVIEVQADLPVVVNLTIERGAAVSGTVLYDDGSPASEVRLTLLIRRKGEWIRVPSTPLDSSHFYAETDDRGHYRMSGLPSGEYLLQASLELKKTTYKMDEKGVTSMSMTYSNPLEVYTGGSIRRKDGVPFTVNAGEEVGGQDIDIPLSKLHTVRGSIQAAHDGRVLNGGSLSLLHADDKSNAGHATVNSDDSTFQFGFVAEGDYIVHVDEAADNEYREVRNKDASWPPTRTETHTLRRYGQADLPVHVSGDLSGLVVNVPNLPVASSSSE